MKTEIDLHPRHITILISPTGEEFYEAYGPMTKDRGKATLFFTNDKTLREPPRFGNSGEAFWNSERDAASKARREYRGWTYRHEPQTPPDVAERLEYLRGELRAARMSYGEIAELQELAPHIQPGDVELLEAAGVPESRSTQLDFMCNITESVKNQFAEALRVGEVPEDWDHNEIQQWLADKFAGEVFRYVMKGGRLREYRRAVAISSRL